MDATPAPSVFPSAQRGERTPRPSMLPERRCRASRMRYRFPCRRRPFRWRPKARPTITAARAFSLFAGLVVGVVLVVVLEIVGQLLDPVDRLRELDREIGDQARCSRELLARRLHQLD